MKKILLTSILTCVLTTISQGAALLQWSFSENSNGGPASQSPTSVATNIDVASDLSRGTGAPSNGGANTFFTNGFPATSAIDISSNAYFEFSISIATGYTLSLDSIDSRISGNTNFLDYSPIMQYAYSLDGTNFTLIGSPQGGFSSTTTVNTDLSIVGALQNLTASQTVTLRLYAASGNAGNFGYQSNGAGGNALVLNGTITPIPEPSTALMLIGSGLGCLMFTFRRRKRLLN